MKQGIIILAVTIFVSLVVAFATWAHHTPAPQAFVVPDQDQVSASSTPPTDMPAAQDSAKPAGAAATSTPTATALASFKSTMTTYFYVGEPSDADNDFIPNNMSYWDEQWQTHFGGVDDPANRCGYRPCGFTPKENPFYFALPYAEFDQDGNLKSSAKQVPWYAQTASSSVRTGLLLKNHWIEVTHDGHTCFAQWEDVGPNNEDDFAYVFGSAPTPTNTFGEKAGLDVSPAMWDCLGMTDNDTTSWRFVDASDVSPGPWKDIITSSGSTWAN